MKLTAVKLRNGKYAIRPQGTLGTCGWINGKAWTVKFVTRLPKGIKLEN